MFLHNNFELNPLMRFSAKLEIAATNIKASNRIISRLPFSVDFTAMKNIRAIIDAIEIILIEIDK